MAKTRKSQLANRAAKSSTQQNGYNGKGTLLTTKAVLKAAAVLGATLAIVFTFTPTFRDIGQANAEDRQDVNNLEWWKKTNFYHIYLRSFKDSDGDGNGDLRGVVEKLDYLQQLGVETLLMAPFYSSPMKDCGYDISDYEDIHPMFGSMQDFDDLVAGVRERGMKMLIDFVPNHSSNKHPWFNCSEYAYVDPEGCGKYADWYVWSNSTRFRGKYPTNWVSEFGGGPAWTWSPVRKQFYLHQFLPEQPDFNLRNPEVREALKEIVRFWFRKGIDGIRVDSAHFMFEDEQMRDDPDDPEWQPGMNPAYRLLHVYTRSLPESAQALRDWQDVASEPEFSNGSRKIIVSEAYDKLANLMPFYGPNPETPYANMPFNFELLKVTEQNMGPQTSELFILTWINATRALNWPDQHGAMAPWILWVTGNHDNPRATNRLGYQNAAAFRWITHLVPGVPVNYYGDEMGMIDVPYSDIPESTVKEGEPTRLPERAPIAWTSEDPSGGFSNTSSIWLPLERNYKSKNVASFLAAKDDNNFLQMSIKLIKYRKDNMALLSFGDLVFFRNEPSASTSIFAMARTHEKFGNVLMLANLDKKYAGRSDPSKRSKVNLKPNESILKRKQVSPPKRGVVLMNNIEPGREVPPELRVGAEVDLDQLTLDQAAAVLIKY